jgi:spore germination protein KC
MRRWRWVLTLGLMAGLVSGCWNNAPIDSRALVLLMGVAPGPGQALRIYFQAPTKSGLRAVVSSGGSGGSSGASFFVVSGTGGSVADAFTSASCKWCCFPSA